MLRSEIQPGVEYALREKRAVGAPFQRVRILEHIRKNKWKVKWIEPNPGLIDYVESGQLIVPWKDRKAFLKEEESAERIQNHNDRLGYKEQSPIAHALYEIYGLILKCKDAAGNPRLFSPDELGHLLEKAQIQHASFAYVLNTAFYKDQFEVLMGRGVAATFHASLSILGGLVDEKFQDLFSAATVSGLYDRFVFGQCPTGFLYEYEPFEGVSEATNPADVAIDANVWQQKAKWRIEDPELEGRICELAIRVAAICASFDGRAQLTAEALGPARAFADYQKRIRRLLKPNAGESLEGKAALKILDYLDRFGGRFVSKRKMLRDINANRLGPSVVERGLDVLHANGELQITKGRPVLVRRCLDDELELLSAQEPS